MASSFINLIYKAVSDFSTSFIDYSIKYHHCWEELPTPCRPDLNFFYAPEAPAPKMATVSPYEYGYLTLPAPTAPPRMQITVAPNPVAYAYKGTAAFDFSPASSPASGFGSANHFLTSLIAVLCFLVLCALCSYFLVPMIDGEMGRSTINASQADRFKSLAVSLMSAKVELQRRISQLSQRIDRLIIKAVQTNRFKELSISLMKEKVLLQSRIDYLEDQLDKLRREKTSAANAASCQPSSFAAPSTAFDFAAPGLKPLPLRQAVASFLSRPSPIFGGSSLPQSRVILPAKSVIPKSAQKDDKEAPAKAEDSAEGNAPETATEDTQPPKTRAEKGWCKNKSPSQRKAAKKAKEAAEAAEAKEEEAQEKKGDEEGPKEPKNKDGASPSMTDDPIKASNGQTEEKKGDEEGPKEPENKDVASPSTADDPTKASNGQNEEKKDDPSADSKQAGEEEKPKPKKKKRRGKKKNKKAAN